MLVRSLNGMFFQTRLLNMIDGIFGKFKQRLLIEYFFCTLHIFSLLKSKIFKSFKLLLL